MGFISEETLSGGLKALRFEMLGDSLLDDLNNPDTKCYCNKDKICYRQGLGNIAPCSHSKKLFECFKAFILLFALLKIFQSLFLSHISTMEIHHFLMKSKE